MTPGVQLVGNTEAMGWLEDRDTANQHQMEEHRRRFGGDDWIAEMDRDLPPSSRRAHGIRAIVFSLGVVGVTLYVVVRWLASAL